MGIEQERMLDDIKKLVLDENVRQQLHSAAEGLGLPKQLSPPQRLELTSREVADVQRFQPLFQTPRSVKRFANTYCLIRVGVEEGDWSDFLGNTDRAGNYRIPMLMLAVTSAFPSLARPWLNWMIETSPKSWHFKGQEIHSLMASFGNSTEETDWEQLAQSLGKLNFDDWPEPTQELLVKWAPRVARYSF